jgi:hypothetical protein
MQQLPLLDSAGAQVINDAGLKATYMASGTLSVVTGATDAIIINGSATKTIKVTKVGYYAIASSALVLPILFIKRRVANTGGTSSAATAVPLDSNNAAATAVVTLYTANPSALGAAVGTILSDSIAVPTALALTANDESSFEFGLGIGRQPIVLRGTAQGLAINLSATAITSGVLTYYLQWTEE